MKVSALRWIVASGLGMSAIALVGSAALLMRPEALERAVKPLVAFAALGASDLVPEVNRHAGLAKTALHFGAFAAGLSALWCVRALFGA